MLGRTPVVEIICSPWPNSNLSRHQVKYLKADIVPGSGVTLADISQTNDQVEL